MRQDETRENNKARNLCCLLTSSVENTVKASGNHGGKHDSPRPRFALYNMQMELDIAHAFRNTCWA